ncbi:MAG: peptide transporter [Rhizobacter sp.]|nr:peptide transporter [Rhizobacter sp.]
MRSLFHKSLSLIALAVALTAGASTASLAQTRGGVVNVAMIGEVPTLDPMASTADLVGTVTQHFYETLFAFDGQWAVTPLLAQSMPEISADNRTYTIALRTGVTFHNGAPMTATDVVDSLKRWTRVAPRGKQVAANIDSIEAVDATHVRIKLKEPYVPLLSLLAFNNSAAVIMPAGTPDTAPKTPVGTGPYQVREYKPDQYLQLTRFDKYAPRTEASNGYAGARKQYLDEIRFVPVPDVNTRIEGAVSGQYDYADAIGAEAFERLKGKAEPFMLKPAGWSLFVLNTKSGAFANQNLRLAMQAALSMDDIQAASVGRKDFYNVEGALYPAGYVWHTDEGVKGHHNLADPEKAAALLKAGAYDGKPIRILTTRQYESFYQQTQVAGEYLKAAGFKVDIQVMDWATVGQRRANPELWDMFVTASPFLPEPALIATLSETYPGWWSTPARKKAVDAFNSEADPAKRIKAFGEVQKVVFAEAPWIKIGDYNSLAAKSAALKGMSPSPWPFFWNAYKN